MPNPAASAKANTTSARRVMAEAPPLIQMTVVAAHRTQRTSRVPQRQFMHLQTDRKRSAFGRRDIGGRSIRLGRELVKGGAAVMGGRTVEKASDGSYGLQEGRHAEVVE